MSSYQVQALCLFLLGASQAVAFAVHSSIPRRSTPALYSYPASYKNLFHVQSLSRRLCFNHKYFRTSKRFSSALGYNDQADQFAATFVRSVLDEGGGGSEGILELSQCEGAGCAQQILSVFPASTMNSWTKFSISRNDSNPFVVSKKTTTRTFRMDLAYLGTGTCGWQRQPNDPRTSIQQRVEGALEQILGHSIDLRAAGRTDAGVHAIRQTTRFKSNRTSVSSLDLQHRLNQNPLMFLNSTQPGQLIRMIRCLHIQETHSAFHPGFGATARSYVYLKSVNASSESEANRLVAGLNRLLRPIVGVPLDYYGLSHGKLSKEHYNCTVSFAAAYRIPDLEKEESSTVATPLAIGVALTSDRFLRRMVRNLVATAIACCLSAADSSPVADDESTDFSLLRIIQDRDRRRSSKAAPADGLVFVGAEYG